MRRKAIHHASPWTRVKRAFRAAVVHVLLDLASGHAANSLAVVALAALTAIPADLLASCAWLRAATPIAIAALGMLARCAGRHSAMEKEPS